MHVLIVPSWYPTSEAPLDGIYFAEQARCLARHGLQVGVIYPEQQSLRRLSWTALRRKYFQVEWNCEEGIPTLRRYGWNVWSRFPPGLRCRVRSAVRLADRYVDRHGVPDLLHAQSGRWAGAAAARIGTRHGIPYALTEHFSGLLREAVFPWRWPLLREGYDGAGAVTAVSTALQRAVANHDLAPSSEVEIHPNVAPARFFRPPLSGRPSPPPFRFVTIARLKPSKNVAGLLEAFARVASSEPERITLTVVATASGGPEDLVTPDTGLLVPPGDPEALAEGLRTLRRRWSAFDPDAIRARTREQFGPEAYVRRTRALYRRALRGADS